MTLQEAIKIFKFHCTYEKNLSSKTMRAYDIDINQFLGRFITYEIKKINKFDLKDYVENLYLYSYKIKTIKRKIAVLKAFFNYLEFEELIDINPFRKLKLSLKEPKLLPKTLELKEIKIILKHLYQLKNNFPNRESFSYKLLVYNPLDKDNMIDRNSCGYVPRNELTKKGKENERANRIEWEHIMPAENFGKHLPCWKDGGRKACSKDPVFNKMEADMHNLVPAIGELNADRSNLRYGANKPKVGMYGECKFEVDFDANRTYVRDEIKGDISRAYLYMSKTYNINLSDQERKMMEVWDKQDPIDEWEIEKNKKIEKYSR